MTPLDWIIDELMPTLRFGPLKVLVLVDRLTHGYGRPSYQMGFDYIAEKTGLSRRAAIDSIRELGPLLKITPGTKGRGLGACNTYALNIDLATGELIGPRSDKDKEGSPPSPTTHGKQRSPERRSEPDAAQLQAFDEFYLAYPRKVAKKTALKAWLKMKPDQALRATMLAALEEQKKSESWQKDKGTFIPYPASWINGSRWEDEILGDNSATHEPVVEDLGNGMVVVDGVTMTRKTYELRYGPKK